jgi:hypothetical protein
MSASIYKRITLFIILLTAISTTPSWFSVIMLLLTLILIRNYFEGIVLAMILDGSKMIGENYNVTFLITIVSILLIIISGRIKMLLK